MVPFLKGAFGVDQDVGDVLDVADLTLAAAHLQQRIVSGASCIGGIELQHPAKASPPTGGQLPVLALNVMNDGRAWPGEERRHNEPHALARSRWGEAEHVLGPVMAQVVRSKPAQDHAIGTEEPGPADVLGLSPACGAVSGHPPRLPRPPDRQRHRHDDGQRSAGDDDPCALNKDLGRVGVEGEPPQEEIRRRVNPNTGKSEPRCAEFGLVGQPPGCPFGRRPEADEDDQQNGEDLAPKDLGSRHGQVPEFRRRARASGRGARRWRRPA